MRISKIEVKRTVSKNYQSKTIGVEVSLEPDDDIATAQQAAEIYVATHLGETPDENSFNEMRRQVELYDKAQELMKKLS